MSINSMLERVFEGAITGTGLSTLDVRKKLSIGQVIRIGYAGQDYEIKVEEGKALLLSGTSVMLERVFIPWDESDDKYQEMLDRWALDGEISEDCFLQASNNFHSRFLTEVYQIKQLPPAT